MDTRERVAFTMYRFIPKAGETWESVPDHYKAFYLARADAICAIFAEERAWLADALEAARREPYQIIWRALKRAGVTRANGCPDDIVVEEIEKGRKAEAREAALVAAAQAAIDLGWTHDDECHPSDGRHSVRCIEARRVMALLRAALYLAPVSGEGKSRGLSDLQAEQVPWVKHNFGDRPSWMPLLGAVEELGELAHAHLRQAQGIRVSEDHDEKAKDAVADVVIYLADYCSARGFDMQSLVMETWDRVKLRDWKANPADAAERAEPKGGRRE